MNEGLFPAKLGLLFFWMLWLWIAFLTNLCGGLKALGVLPRSWRFASDNFRTVAEAASRYRAPPWLAVFLFAAVATWQFLSSWLFGQAVLSSLMMGHLDYVWVDRAFAVGLGLWAALLIADEFFLRYENEATHLLIFIAQLVTWLSLYFLPS